MQNLTAVWPALHHYAAVSSRFTLDSTQNRVIIILTYNDAIPQDFTPIFNSQVPRNIFFEFIPSEFNFDFSSTICSVVHQSAMIVVKGSHENLSLSLSPPLYWSWGLGLG
jgi:hypothetical protein